jgi:hypothetical protein
MEVGLRKTSPREIIGKGMGSAPEAKYTTLDCLQHFWEMAVAIVETTIGVTDANDRLIEGFTGVAHRFGKGAPQVASKVLITIIGQAVVKTLCNFRHPLILLTSGV